jgi:WD40 repeat protein
MAPKRIYLSSTFADLKAHRAAVGLALERAGLQVARMEAYVAADERPLELCLKDVARCDLYVGLVGWRAGYVPPAEHGNPQGLTITELEYRQAKTSAIPALVFMTRPEAREAWPEPFDDARSGASDGGAGILALRERLGREQTVSHFAEPDELATLVLAALMRHGVGQRPWQLPPLAEGTVGRPALETALQRLLERPGPPLLVHGGGGFGKTRLVVRSCASPEAVARFEGGLVWVTLGERPALAELLRNLVIELSGQPPAVAGVEALARAARDLMAQAARGRRWLLVVDDAWRAEDLHPWLAVAATDVVVTSRIREILAAAGVAAARELPIEDMVPIEARALLMRGLEDEADNRAGQPPVPGARSAEAAAYERACNDFADRLGGWPLLIALANARLQEERRRDARSATARPPLARLAAVCTVFERKGVLGFDRARGGRDDAIARSLELSLDFVEEEHSGVAGRAAELAIFPADQPVPTATLAQLWAMDPFDVGEQVLRPLDNASLLAWDRATDTVRVHDLVAAALCTRLRDAAAVHARLLQAWGEPHALPDAWAWRWYGWHAVRAGDAVRLQRLLSDAVWLRAKLRHAGLDSLLAEFNLAPMPGAVQRIGAALLLSADVLAASPEQLVPHLLGRLLPLDGGAIDPGLVPLAASAAPAMAGEAWLRPRSGGLVAAGGALLRSFDVGGEWPERLWVDEAGRKAVVVTSRLPGAGHQVALWDLATSTRLRVLPEVKVWDAADGRLVHTLPAHARRIQWITPLPDARRVAVLASDTRRAADGDSELALIDIERGEREGAVMAPGLWFGDAQALSPDGHYVVLADRNRGPLLWSLPQRAAVGWLDESAKSVMGLVFARDGSALYIGAEEGCLRRWQMPAGPMTMLGAGTPLGPDGPRLSPRIGIRCLALNEYAPSPLLLAGDDRGRVTAWDPASGRLLATVQADSRLVNDLLCLPGGRAVSTGGDCTLVVHAPDLSRVLVRSSLGDSIAYGLAATPDGRYLGAAAVDGWFTVWSTDSGTRLAGFHVEGGAQCCVALRDGSGFAVGDRAGGVHVLTLEGVA